MWVDLFLCLLLAHLVADFVFQTSASCKSKSERHERSIHQYLHALIVFSLSWLASWDLSFWWGALIVGVAHLCTDIWKSYRPEDVKWFSLDQCIHVFTLAVVSYLWCRYYDWTMVPFLQTKWLSVLIAVMVCWKPANIFIKMMLKHYSVNMPEDKESGFNAGALIGTIERWLILLFVCLQRYDALGLLIAAKSIIRFSETQNKKSEYVLTGTLLSIFIAVMAGMMIKLVH